MSKDCSSRCSYYKECFGARIISDNLTELQFLGTVLEAGDLCLNGPPERYVSGTQYRDCAVLMGAGLAVELASAEELRLPAINFFAEFLGLRQAE